MKIIPAPNHIQLDIQEIKAGVLNTAGRNTAIEVAEVKAVGKDVADYKVGDKVFVKAWAIDIITHEDKRYYFVDLANNGIKATLR